MENRFEHFSLSIFNISRYWSKIATEEMKKYGLKGSMALYIVVMASCEEKLTAARLSELCERDKAEISRAIAILEEKGLVERVGENYRAGIQLTTDGRAVAESLNERADLVLELAGKGISEDHRKILYQSLDCITENLRAICKTGLPE